MRPLSADSLLQAEISVTPLSGRLGSENRTFHSSSGRWARGVDYDSVAPNIDYRGLQIIVTLLSADLPRAQARQIGSPLPNAGEGVGG